jgi:cell division septum initiation protein DivIVA
VDQLANLVQRGWQIPFTQYRAVRGREADQLIERMRINVPSSIRESERTLAERDRILAEAKAEADRIVDEARRQAVELVSERALLDTARQEMQRIIEEGQADAQRRVEEADRYAVGVLRSLQDELRMITQQVDNGIKVMEEETGNAKENVQQPGAPSRKRPAKSPVKKT